MMLLTIMMKDRKKRDASDEPHVLPGMQFGGSRLQSNIMRFQSSPVETEKSIMKL